MPKKTNARKKSNTPKKTKKINASKETNKPKKTNTPKKTNKPTRINKSRKCKSVPIPEKGIDYLGLPPEVRNHIMSYILVPGEVHPRPSKWPTTNIESIIPCEGILSLKATDEWCDQLLHRDPLIEGRPKRCLGEIATAKSQDVLPKPLPGYQLLAACKTTYEEGRRLFYEENVFHLPLGPVEYTHDWLNKLRPEHKNMIKSVCIEFDPLDITWAAWVHYRQHPSRYMEHSRMDALYHLCHCILMRKILFLLTWQTLETIHMKSPNISLTLKKANCRAETIHNHKQLQRGMFDVLRLGWHTCGSMDEWIRQAWIMLAAFEDESVAWTKFRIYYRGCGDRHWR